MIELHIMLYRKPDNRDFVKRVCSIGAGAKVGKVKWAGSMGEA